MQDGASEALPLMHTLHLEQPQQHASHKKQHGLSAWARSACGSFSPELLAIALVYFVQGILKLASLAVAFFYKNELALEPTQLALADTITGLPWAVKPLYGFITDSFPIRGMRRRPYLIITGLLGCVAWLCMAALANSVTTAVACLTVAAAATAFSDVVADSIVVQLARESPGATEGSLQSMCWSAHAFGRLLTAYLSGSLLGKWGPRPVFAATATFPLIVCASSCLIKEGATGKRSSSAAQQSSSSSSLHEQHEEKQQLLPLSSQAAAGGAGAATAAGGTEEVAGVSGRGLALSSQGSAEVLLSQLQLTQGHLHHKHRSLAAAEGVSTPTAAAAADGGGSDVLGCQAGDSLQLLRGSSSNGSSGGRLKTAKLTQQAAANMLQSVRLFWQAIKQPHMLQPVMFLFLFQAMPQPDTAMFYFKTNSLGFDAEYLGRVKLVAALADLAGLAVYNTWLKAARLRPMMLWGALLGCAVGLTPLMLVEGVNRKMGVSDRLFALVDSALLASIGQVLMMPTLVLCARLCPEGVEATLYASLMSLNNAAVGVSSLLGACMMSLFGITSTNFTHLTALLLTCNLMSLLPLPLVRWVPDSSTQAAGGASGGASV